MCALAETVRQTTQRARPIFLMELDDLALLVTLCLVLLGLAVGKQVLGMVRKACGHSKELAAVDSEVLTVAIEQPPPSVDIDALLPQVVAASEPPVEPPLPIDDATLARLASLQQRHLQRRAERLAALKLTSG